MSRPGLPGGFCAERHGAAELIVRVERRDALLGAGLGEARGWLLRLAVAPIGRGRGATARVELEPGIAARVKQLRRGGALGRLWRDAFAGRHRILANLTIALEARRRGVPTPEPLALLVVRAGPALYRGWLAVEEIRSASDLGAVLAVGTPEPRRAIGAAMRVVRAMHDRGIEHRDLNLGNVLLRFGLPAGPEALIIDLDRARVHTASLSFARRQRALRRLERSFVKSRSLLVSAAAIRDLFYEQYAADDAALARRLERGRSFGRLLIALHRLTWYLRGRAA